MAITPETNAQISQLAEQSTPLWQFPEVRDRMSAEKRAKSREMAQIHEVVNIKTHADAVEARYKELGLALPSVYGIFTAGFDVPPESEQIGTYGLGPFVGFPPPRHCWSSRKCLDFKSWLRRQ